MLWKIHKSWWFRGILKDLYLLEICRHWHGGHPSWASLAPSAVHNVTNGLMFPEFPVPCLNKGTVGSFGSFLFYALYSICWNLSRNCLVNFLWEVMGFSFSRRAFWKCQRPEVSPSSLTQWVWPLHSYTLLTARPPRPSSKQEPLLCAGWAVADSSATNPHPRLPEGRSHSQPHGVWQTLWSCGEFVDHPKDNVPALLLLRGEGHAVQFCSHWSLQVHLQGQTCRWHMDACISTVHTFTC